MARTHVHPVTIYYEDTDHSGLVYHANYLKYFERAREPVFGVDELASMFVDDGVGFVVYEVRLRFREGAKHGDVLEIRSELAASTPWRVTCKQEAWRTGGSRALVEGEIEMVCVDRDGKLVKLPERVHRRLADEGA